MTAPHGPSGVGDLPSADDVARAAARLAGVAHRTPTLTSATLDTHLHARLHLKAEHQQRAGAFKFRGAYHATASLPGPVGRRGVVTFSSGNHAQAIALACAMQGVPATIVMPTDAPQVKLDRTRRHGAEVVLYDRDTEDRAALATAVAERTGGVLVPPFDHPDVIAGQGTAAAELLADVPELDLLIAPIGGGGLLAGCALAIAATGRHVELVGVEPAVRTAAREALADGAVVEVPVPATLLDGQRTTHIGHRPLAVLRAAGARVVGVSDEAAMATVAWLSRQLDQQVEPSGAAALAATLDGTIDVRGRTVGIVLSGGNIGPATLARAPEVDELAFFASLGPRDGR